VAVEFAALPAGAAPPDVTLDGRPG
jgi:hypothetical protein